MKKVICIRLCPYDACSHTLWNTHKTISKYFTRIHLERRGGLECYEAAGPSGVHVTI